MSTHHFAASGPGKHRRMDTSLWARNCDHSMICTRLPLLSSATTIPCGAGDASAIRDSRHDANAYTNGVSETGRTMRIWSTRQKRDERDSAKARANTHRALLPRRRQLR